MWRKAIRRTLMIGAAAVGIGSMWTGCADPESVIFIRQVMTVGAPDCSVQADPSAVSQLGGILDISQASQYQAVLLVGNQLVGRGSTTLVRTETSRVAFHTAEVVVEDTLGNQVGGFSVPITGFADPAESAVPGFGLVVAPILDVGSVNRFANSVTNNARVKLISKIKVFGRTLGGSEVESNEFQFTVDLCRCCLLQFGLTPATAPGGSPTCEVQADQEIRDDQCNRGQDRGSHCVNFPNSCYTTTNP